MSELFLDMLPILSGKSNRIDFDLVYTPDADSIVSLSFADISFPTPIKLVGYVKNMAGYMVLHTDVSLSYETDCARCAEKVSAVLSFSFDKDIASGNVSPDNDDYIYITDKKLDLIEPVDEQLLMELPSRTLCRDDCLGLCPKCGKNLNLGKCSCETHEVDPRLAILKTLLK
ncbi:MAG: DUF177 domain-containing protein [Clostridia bacterium]|nr:DUF177 domain-containing protein [Clostridia bacterium]